MMVASMNGASKFTKKDGEEEMLGGIIFTKNLKLGMKMPEKIREGRNNWLLMEKDPTYEDEEMGESCESNFEYCNEMSSNLMPRDFLAALTRHFIRVSDTELSFFQEAHREASEIMSKQRPHYRKRKAKSSSLFISIYFLIEKEVGDSCDEAVEKLFVEAFGNRDYYINLLMSQLNRVDEIEAVMTEGQAMKLPGWACAEGDVLDTNDESIRATTKAALDVDQIVMDTLSLLTPLAEVDRSKYAKIFHAGEMTLAIQHSKVKNLAKEKNEPAPKFATQSKHYPSFVVLKTEAFTKMDAKCSKGAANTKAGFCTSIRVVSLGRTAQSQVKEFFELSDEDFAHVDNALVDDIEASQEVEIFTQSQDCNILKVCNVCNYETRPKHEYHNHITSDPKCDICSLVFPSEVLLNEHKEALHRTVVCNTCNARVAEKDLNAHVENHKV